MGIKKILKPIKAVLYSQIIGGILFRKYFLKRIAEAIKPKATVLKFGPGNFPFLHLINKAFQKQKFDI